MQEYENVQKHEPENENRESNGIVNNDPVENKQINSEYQYDTLSYKNNAGTTESSGHTGEGYPQQQVPKMQQEQQTQHPTYGAVYTPYGGDGYSYTPYVSQENMQQSYQQMPSQAPYANFREGNQINNQTGNNQINHQVGNQINNKRRSSGGKIALISALVVLCILLFGVSAYMGTMLARTYGSSLGTEQGDTVLSTPEGDKQGPTVNIVDIHDAGVDTVKVERGELMNIPQAAAAVKDSVVEITTESVSQGQGFFNQYVTSGAGSGVIISENGFIITNNHVIDEATTITVRLTDGTEYPAALIGQDADTDVAVIKITPNEGVKLTCAIIGNSDLLLVGEDVIVIGNPLGELGGTVTNGIISATEREVTVSNETMTLLQTNAAVNPGNSGGGMFNLYGELVGIINAKSSGNNVEGLGFAIPVNKAWGVAQELIDFGYVRGRPDMGINIMDVTSQSYARFYFNSYSTGVYIYEVNDKSEFKYGDRIISFNGTEITSSADVASQLKSCSVGDEVTVVVMRGGKTVEIKTKLLEKIPEGNNN